LEKLRIIGRYSPEIIAKPFLKLMEAKDAKTNNNKFEDFVDSIKLTL